MPALFAYLIAVGILLGGGYGALSWLAAPEPIKVAAKAKPKPPPHYTANSEASSSESTAPTINDSVKAATRSDSTKAVDASNNRPPSSVPETPAATGGRDAQAALAGPPHQDARSAHAEVSSQETTQHAEISPVEAKPEDKRPAPAVSPAPPGDARTAAPVASVAAAKSLKRPRLRQASRQSNKRARVLMTLRTIEFADGRRVTQLIPYRSGERALAFERDE